jgi:signal transduction histidine kinase
MVRIERVIADGNPFVPVAARLTLPPRIASVEINYTAVSLSAASKTRFSYLLEGFDRDWVDAGTRRQAFYTRLPPGRYRFLVRASIDGVEQSVARSELSVLPAFYQQTWFYAFSVAMLGLTFWAFWHWRIRSLQAQFALVLAERARIGREVHDTVLQGMAGVAMQLEGVGRRLDIAPAMARQELRRIGRQLRQHIEEARETILTIRTGVGERRLATALSEFGARLSNGARVQVSVTGTCKAPCPDIERELMRIAQEAMRNAVRHGRAKYVRVDVHYEPNAIRLGIKDDGSGFDPKEAAFAEQPHWGLIGMRERAKKIGAELRIDSHLGSGTQVEVVVQRPEAQQAMKSAVG